ncbi:MAG: hypothetical protein RLZZ455_450 [Candidatus Parcubacteria bacterium]|jgi:spore germination protein YaaH
MLPVKKGIPFLIILIVIAFLVVVVIQKAKGKIGADFTRSLPALVEPTSKAGDVVPSSLMRKSIFVPYWTLAGNETVTLDQFERVLYFGVAVDENGIDTKDPGYTTLPVFSEQVVSQESFLVVRMTDRQKAIAVLRDKDAQEKIVRQSILLAEQYGFSGVVLDLEVTALPFESLVQQITGFALYFSDEVEKNGLQSGMTVYGDTFYRIRPFAISAIAKKMGTMYIMAYDFHKSGGNPGPNFPLSGKDRFGYDFKTMLSQFLASVPPEKLSVIYGMYGYDWIVDDSGNVLGDGEAVSLLQIESTILKECEKLSCEKVRDTDASEMRVAYIDNDGVRHVVWYEDDVSVAAKEKTARMMGIGSASFWAYSYF